uniref:exodeoxyribonuclease III n=1 Tax=Cyprinus carpio TaxID=7962 RepID=A0A8C2DY46_CYPCA
MTGFLKILEENNVQFVTWNCKGLNGAVKRGNILAHFRKLGADVVFLQETHLKNHAQKQLYKNVFHSKFNCKSRGTAIIINKSIPFITSDVISDPNGRYIIVTGELYYTPVTLANIFAPNYDDEKFVDSVLAILPNLHSHDLILAGDFNLVMDTVLDRSSNRQQSVSKSAKLIQIFYKSANIIEVWRYINPTPKKYSFFSQLHNSYSRIDYFFLDFKLLSSVKYIDYEVIVLSDHAPLKLQLTLPNRYTSRTWRMDNSLLSNETHV